MACKFHAVVGWWVAPLEAREAPERPSTASAPSCQTAVVMSEQPNLTRLKIDPSKKVVEFKHVIPQCKLRIALKQSSCLVSLCQLNFCE